MAWINYDEDYARVFHNAARNLNQPAAGQSDITGGTKALADAFVNRYQEKTGQAPSEQQVKDFVSQNLNQNYAQNYILGNLNGDSIKTQIVDPYIQTNPDIVKSQTPTPSVNPAVPSISDITGGLQNRQDAIYGSLADTLSQRINDIYNKQRAQALNEENSQGSRLYSGSYRAPGSVLNTVEENRGNTLSSALSNLMTQRASGQTDLSKTLAGIQESERGAALQNQQFGQSLALNRMLGLGGQNLQNRRLNQDIYQTDINRGLQERGLSLSEILGRMQAEARKPGILDYINTGANATIALSKLIPAFTSGGGGGGGGDASGLA